MSAAAVSSGDRPLNFPLLFLSPAEARLLDALVESVIPGEDGSPGASEAGVVEYIDRGLAGFLRDVQHLYRDGLRRVAQRAAELCGAPLTALDADGREVLAEHLDALRRQDPSDPLGRFFAVVREHTVQGFFGDPAHGGNRGLAGWRLVGYPGAQWGFTAEQMAPGFDTSTIPLLTVADLYARLNGRLDVAETSGGQR